MTRVYTLLLVFLLALMAGCDSAPEPLVFSEEAETTPEQHQSEPVEPEVVERFSVDTRFGRSTADPFDGNDRVIRVLVSYNDTNFFYVDGQPKGLEYELMHGFEQFVNKGRVAANRKWHVVFIAVPFDQLLPLLLDGSADVVAAGLTVTDTRKAQVAFTKPYRTHVREVLVRSNASEPIDSLEALSGKKVHVVRASSYFSHLETLNRRFTEKGMEPVRIVQADPSLAAEDLLQMTNANILQYTVVDDHVALIWSEVLDGILIQENFSIHDGGSIAWAVRKGNLKLLASLDKYIVDNKKGTLLGNILFKRYYENTRWIENPLTDQYSDKLDQLRPLFKKYGREYEYDWSLLSAVAFQESHFDQQRRSRAGAVGIMQIKPSTAADKNVGIDGIAKSAEKNIHAAAKYLAFIRDRYFSETGISDEAKVDFTLAAYNAGPRRIQSLRKEAAKAGLDPNQWFFNVENAAQRKIGRETVDYVANVNKYQIAFAAMDRLLAARATAVKTMRRDD